MAHTDIPAGRPIQVDFQQIFQLMPGMCLVLDPSFKILAQNLEHAKATLSEGKEVVGRGLFEVYPDNPNDSNADGVSAVRQSLLNVLRTRGPDVMPIVRYDVKPVMGGYQAKYWAITNTPVLGSDGYVQWIINHAHDVTELIELRAKQATGAPFETRGKH